MQSTSFVADIPAARRLLVRSFIALAVAGASVQISYWSMHGEAGTGLLRGVAFVLCMAAAHAVGFRAYRDQVPANQLWKRVGARVKLVESELLFTVVLQLSLLLLSSILLDNGLFCHLVLLGAAGYWAGAVTILTSHHPITREDRLFLRAGQLAVMGLVLVMAVLMGRSI